MKKNTFITSFFIFLLLLLSASSCNAIVLGSEIDNIVDTGISLEGTEFLIIGTYDGTGKYAVWQTNFDGSSQEGLLIHNLTNIVDACELSTGKLTWLDSNGNVYRKTGTGLLNWDSKEPSDYILLASVSGSTFNSMCVDGEDNIYIAHDTTVTILSAPYYTSSLYYDCSYNALSVHPHPDGILVSDSGSSTAYAKYVKLITGSETAETIYTRAASGVTYPIYDLAATSNGDVYFRTDATGLSRLNYSDSYSMCLVTNVIHQNAQGLNIDNNGIIATGYLNSLYEYSTVDLIGGFFFTPVGSGIPELSYGLSDVTPISTNYYNNSDLDFTVNIVTEELSVYEIQTVFPDYEFLIKLFDNNNVIVETKIIKSSSFSAETATEGIIGWFDWLLLGDKFATYAETSYFANTNNWENGTYTLKLYEHNLISGNLAVLDTDTLEVLQTQFTGSVSTNTDIDNIDTTDISSILLASPYFSATIIILSISMAAAAAAGGVGFLGGLFISNLLCVGVNLLPDWTILLCFVVCLFGILIIGKR